MSVDENITTNDPVRTPQRVSAHGFDLDGMRLAVLSIPLEPSAWPAEMTEAEKEITRGLIRGNTYGEIAHQRNVSANTVASQVASILRKTGARSAAELIATIATREARSSEK
jgi:DNA-binding NarL/FixJ family response regulator